MTDTHSGTCFCGAVAIEVTGAPEAMGYCHCELLPLLVRRARECLHFVEAAEREDHEGGAIPRPLPENADERPAVLHEVRWASVDRAPDFGLTDVYAATIPGVAFKPGVHVNYAESVLPIRDGLPKMKGLPG